MIEVERLSKRYGGRTVVDDVTFRVDSGRVTGFLGPNGAGKSTTMRMLLGLTRPDAGSSAIDGRPYQALTAPLREVGALLETAGPHRDLTAENHLRWLAASSGIDRRRIGEVLDAVGLRSAARRRVGTFSLGMKQRLGLAGALLGDPPVLILDEPVNGLDPEGIRWLRDLLRSLASQGRTVLVSSHLMAEMAVTADHLLVLDKGRLLADLSTTDFIEAHAVSHVRAQVSDPWRLHEHLRQSGTEASVLSDGSVEVDGSTTIEISNAAGAAGVQLYELSTHHTSLEDAFLALLSGGAQ